MTDIWDAEGNAAELYDRANTDASNTQGIGALAKALLGPRCIRLLNRRDQRNLLIGDAKLVRYHEQWRIYLRDGLPKERSAFAIAHELAEWRYHGCVNPDLERACNALAAALLLPRRTFLTMTNEPFADIARMFHVTETCAALRLGEVTQRPLVVLTKTFHFVRGREWNWPIEHRQIQLLARRETPGLTKIPLTDASRRTVLLADDDCVAA